ncbi:MAG: hypothetical protein M5R42_02425 [Rhodocyclaceae bacterium]|nr:hypothetical protein [Rhodocyclaceae bacterium]
MAAAMRICALSMLAALPGAVMAQGMKDPTRPPPQFLDPADVAQAAMPPDSGLQSIKRTGKRYLALLNGEWVKPGDRAGEAVVVKIAEQSVVLSYPDGRRETIGMYPDIELRPKEVQSRPRKAAGRTVGK